MKFIKTHKAWFNQKRVIANYPKTLEAVIEKNVGRIGKPTVDQEITGLEFSVK